MIDVIAMFCTLVISIVVARKLYCRRTPTKVTYQLFALVALLIFVIGYDLPDLIGWVAGWGHGSNTPVWAEVIQDSSFVIALVFCWTGIAAYFRDDYGRKWSDKKAAGENSSNSVNSTSTTATNTNTNISTSK